MARLAQSLLHTLSTIVLVLVIGLAFSGSANAGNASIGFAGHVPAHSKSQSLRNFPQTVVSFSAQAALPVQSLLSISHDLRVFDEAGNWLQSARQAKLPANNGNATTMLVTLNANKTQTFIVCAGSKRNCMRYTVNRF